MDGTCVCIRDARKAMCARMDVCVCVYIYTPATSRRENLPAAAPLIPFRNSRLSSVAAAAVAAATTMSAAKTATTLPWSRCSGGNGSSSPTSDPLATERDNVAPVPGDPALVPSPMPATRRHRVATTMTTTTTTTATTTKIVATTTTAAATTLF